MNIKSEDVVNNVESNNVESTSNEQRQTVKPIVISRRRLLRAGVAGIPVVLTMAGIAPAADGLKTEPSAASAMVYGGNKVYNRFANENGILRDGLVWTDHNGFVLLEAGGVKTEHLTVTTDPNSTGEITFNLTATSYNGTADPPPAVSDYPTKTFTVSIAKPTNLTVNSYLHKTGEWYTDRIVRTGTPADLLDYIKSLELTVKDGTNTVTATVTDKNATFTSSGAWYQTDVQGWNLENTDQTQTYYLLPASNTSDIDSVNFSAKVTFTYTKDDYQYTYDQTVTIPLKLNVSGIPSQVNPGGI